MGTEPYIFRLRDNFSDDEVLRSGEVTYLDGIEPLSCGEKAMLLLFFSYFSNASITISISLFHHPICFMNWPRFIMACSIGTIMR